MDFNVDPKQVTYYDPDKYSEGTNLILPAGPPSGTRCHVTNITGSSTPVNVYTSDSAKIENIYDIGIFGDIQQLKEPHLRLQYQYFDSKWWAFVFSPVQTMSPFIVTSDYTASPDETVFYNPLSKFTIKAPANPEDGWTFQLKNITDSEGRIILDGNGNLIESPTGNIASFEANEGNIGVEFMFYNGVWRIMNTYILWIDTPQQLF